ncbi:MAG TPA: ribosome small subunit-dependent GTPase A [Gemmatimonadales bacterium]|nr:ribosome small subunit-dependent GTPase A [Gemmatimonadales bacterium]HVX89684.1 ribosome small subunit-dependent GTPase A [Gemmatimonadales bacterium]
MSEAPVGVVVERDGAQYRVAVGGREVRAVLRGKMKRGAEQVVVGDRVHLEPEPQGGLHGITAVEPRRSLLERRVPLGRGTRPVAANIDRVLVMTAATHPAPIPSLLDRLLVVAEANDLPATLIVNKTDLDPGTALIARYRQAGYEVLPVSVRSGAGLEAVRARLAGAEAVVTGPSGAGKSSLLNALEPGLALRTGAISEKVKRGTQTTTGAVLVPLAGGGWLVDTPGFSEVGLWGIVPRELASCFPEFRPLLDACRFPDCSHSHEPGCAIQAAAERGEVHPERLASYRLLLTEVLEEPKEWE